MLLLPATVLPSSAMDLAHLLNESLQHIFVSKPNPVTISDHSYPHLYEINISLDGAHLRPDPPRSPVTYGKTTSALQIDHLAISASPLSLGPAKLNVSISATEVQIGQSKEVGEQVVLSLESLAKGNIEVWMRQNDLEAFITTLARNQASKQGITIDGVQLRLRQESDRSLAMEVHLRARKLFLGAAIRITGRLDLDDQLNCKISGLNCSGHGGVAILACGILSPYLRKIDGREFPLLSLPLGGVRLRDVRLEVDDNLIINVALTSHQQ